MAAEVFQVNADHKKRLVLVDSGAGGTVISDTRMFLDIAPPALDVCIQFGTGPKIPIAGTGTVVLCVTDMSSRGTHAVYIKNAYYVPVQPLNILSVFDVLNIHGAAVFDNRDGPSHVRWHTERGDVRQRMLWRHKLPYIESYCEAVPINAIRRVMPSGLGYDVIHSTFGHMGLAKLKQLVAGGYLEAEKLREHERFACSACEAANAKIGSYPSQHDLAATHPNHTLHTDLLHFPLTTVDGMQYLLTCIDEYTRYAFVVLLKKKSDAAVNLLRIMKRGHVLHGLRVKHLRADCGGEFQNAVMRIAKDELGIADQYVPANCHQSNGLIERLNGTLACTIRVVLEKAHLPPALWGEAAVYAAHLYNLTPHTALLERKAASAIPHKLYVQDSEERMQRLYKQLVPFGIRCSIIQTGEKPSKVKKLDPRSIPGLIVGLGPSTRQYRVLALNSTTLYKVHIVRHVVINSQHYTEYFARSAVLNEVKRFIPVQTINVLCAERVKALEVPVTVVAVPLSEPCIAFPTQALIGGSMRAESVSADANEGTEMEIQETDEYAINEQYDRGINRSVSIEHVEPDMQRLSLDAYAELCDLRRAWYKKATELKVRFSDTVIPLNTVSTQEVAVDNDLVAGEPVIVALWHLHDVELWTIDLDNPTFKQAMSGPDADKWLEAFEKEVASLHEHDVYELVDRPSTASANVMKGKVICKVKRDALGHIERFKCRYVGCGYSQREGIDYFEHEVWAPTGQHATLRVLLVYAVHHKLSIRHIDISTAFLHGELNENVYVEQPPIMNDGSNRVWRLKKSLYGLKQAGRQWHLKLCELLNSMGFERAGYDPALFCRTSGSGENQFIFLWVDDLLIFASEQESNKIVDTVLKTFRGRDLGEAAWVLGMSITRDTEAQTIELSQERMIENCVERFGMQKQKSIWIPMDASVEICADPHEKARKRIERQLSETSDHEETERLNRKLQSFDKDAMPLSKAEHSEYMSIIGSVQYIAVVTRPDIAFAASTLARFMACPTNHLMNCAKRLLRYLNTTKDLVLRYDCSNERHATGIHGYSDADFAGCSKTSKSTSGMAILYRGQPVFWRSKRQPIVTSSTTEAELVALNSCALQVLWLKQLLGNDLGVAPLRADMFCDNQSTVTVAHNPAATDRSRHINVKHRKVQELIKNQVLSVTWVPTQEQLADIFTKQMARPQFEHLRMKLHVVSKRA
jgi:hypothetical protein